MIHSALIEFEQPPNEADKENLRIALKPFLSSGADVTIFWVGDFAGHVNLQDQNQRGPEGDHGSQENSKE